MGGNMTADPNKYLDLGTLLTDRIFTHPARVLGAALTAAGVNVYMYNWTHVTPGVIYDAHASDLAYFFALNGQIGVPTTAGAEYSFSNSLVQAWVNFATNG